MNNKERSVAFQDLYGIIAETLEKDGVVRFTAKGKSMLPFIRDGKDQVTIRSLPEHIKKNDVVFYRRKDDSFVLHRVISIKGANYVMCGDNQFLMENIGLADMIGVMTGLERNGKAVDLTSFRSGLYYRFLPLRRTYLRVRRYFASILHKLRKNHNRG